MEKSYKMQQSSNVVGIICPPEWNRVDPFSPRVPLPLIIRLLELKLRATKCAQMYLGCASIFPECCYVYIVYRYLPIPRIIYSIGRPTNFKSYKAQIIHIPQSLTSAVIMWVRFLALILASLGQIKGQVDPSIKVHQKSKDGMIRIPHNETEGTGEIYTSMHQLNKFFEEEKDVIEDLKMITEKKLVSQAAVTGK